MCGATKSEKEETPELPVYGKHINNVITEKNLGIIIIVKENEKVTQKQFMEVLHSKNDFNDEWIIQPIQFFNLGNKFIAVIVGDNINYTGRTFVTFEARTNVNPDLPEWPRIKNKIENPIINVPKEKQQLKDVLTEIIGRLSKIRNKLNLI